MKISYYELEDILAVHKFIIETKGKGLIDKISSMLNLPKSDILRILKRLEKLGVIKDLKINPSIFNCTLVERDRIDATILMKKYGFSLIKEPREDEKDIRIRKLMEENEEMRKEIEALHRDMSMLKRYGKSFKEKIKEVEVVSGE
jgi:DNA-binding Lrp family transcriptional regulator